MKIRKSLAVIAVGAAVCLSGAVALSGCDLFGGGSDKVTEVTELSNVHNEKGNFKLTQDIDYEGGEERFISCSAKTFDGDGHTIKNLNLRGSYGGNSGQIGIFDSVETIKNLYIENVTINAPNNYTNISVLAWSKCNTIENVHIKNLTIKATQPYMGSGFGRSIKEIFVGGFTTVEGVKLINCTLEDSNISVKGYESSTLSNIQDLHVAGMATAASSFSYCGIENTTISVESTSAYSDVECGGLSSRSGALTSLSYCYAQNNTITAKAAWSSKAKVEKNYNTSFVYVGGLAATASTANFCEATKNTINAEASGSLLSGAIAGRVSVVHQSIARNNILTSKGGRSDNYDKSIFRTTGGLAGRITSSVTSTIAINNTASDAATMTVDGSRVLYVGGLAGEFFSSGAITCKKCYVGGNSVSGGELANKVGVNADRNWNIFVDAVFSSIESESVVIVSQNKLKETDWVLENLGLTEEAWILKEGSLPAINTTYTPPEESAE